MIERHFHWRFTAFDEYNNEEKTATRWPLYVEVIGFLSEADARIAAQDIVQRKEFHLNSVYECASCGYQKENADTLKAMVKALS